MTMHVITVQSGTKSGTKFSGELPKDAADFNRIVEYRRLCSDSRSWLDEHIGFP